MMAQKSGKPSRIYDGEYPLTGILRCPECGAGMVIYRTTDTLKDGTKRRIVYYACGAWKNKGTAVTAIPSEWKRQMLLYSMNWKKFLPTRNF
ncbi:MAG: zinc ribbon domain-containing protein [Lachnospiraceae bacterium]|nr:zinc ribbon domain-containing protein [Lachnospiraceae bacterium]